MLSLAVFVIEKSPEQTQRTVSTIKLAGQEPIICPTSEIPKKFKSVETDLIHFISAGHLVLPGFYRALTNTIEYSKKDFAFCKALRLGKLEQESGHARVVGPGERGWNIGGMVVRRWVLQETGIKTDIAGIYGRITSEYRGVEVPHTLFVGDN